MTENRFLSRLPHGSPGDDPLARFTGYSWRAVSAAASVLAALFAFIANQTGHEAPCGQPAGMERRRPDDGTTPTAVAGVAVRLDHNPAAMGVRRQTAEHPFGTIKCWMGATHFLTQKLPKVATVMALNVLAYNMKRVMAIAGVGGLLEAMRA
jgi:hypothetical protein